MSDFTDGCTGLKRLGVWFALFLDLHLKLWKRGHKGYKSSVYLILKVFYDNLFKKEQLMYEFNNDVQKMW